MLRTAKALVRTKNTGRRTYAQLRPKLQKRATPRVKPGNISPLRFVPDHIPRPPPPFEIQEGEDLIRESEIVRRTKEELHLMRQAGKLARQALNFAASLVQPGVSTDSIDAQVHHMIIAAGAYPSPLGYKGYPKSICTSINEVVCHGIPDSRPLQEGDTVNIDVTVFLNGYHGDCNATYFVGNKEKCDSRTQTLIEVAKEAMERGIKVCGPGQPFYLIGDAIETYVAKNGLSVVAECSGHGIGTHFHTYPFILHFRNNEKGTMQPGMVFTIEPVTCEGPTTFYQWDDNWTMVTEAGGWSAQFEQTIAITEDGVEVLTRDE